VQSNLPMHLSPRCRARTRAGTPCRSPAMTNGRCDGLCGIAPMLERVSVTLRSARCRMHGGTSPAYKDRREEPNRARLIGKRLGLFFVELLGKLQQAHLGSYDLLLLGHIGTLLRCRGRALRNPDQLRAPPRLAIGRGAQDTVCQFKFWLTHCLWQKPALLPPSTCSTRPFISRTRAAANSRCSARPGMQNDGLFAGQLLSLQGALRKRRRASVAGDQPQEARAEKSRSTGARGRHHCDRQRRQPRERLCDIDRRRLRRAARPPSTKSHRPRGCAAR
jgi:hypothetical protein